MNSEIITVIGGPHMTISKEEAFFPELDVGFLGEAEKSLPQFLEYHQKGKDISEVKGLLFRRNGQLINTGKVSIADRDLNEFPFPARHLLNMKN